MGEKRIRFGRKSSGPGPAEQVFFEKTFHCFATSFARLDVIFQKLYFGNHRIARKNAHFQLISEFVGDFHDEICISTRALWSCTQTSPNFGFVAFGKPGSTRPRTVQNWRREKNCRNFCRLDFIFAKFQTVPGRSAYGWIPLDEMRQIGVKLAGSRSC